MKMWPDGQTMDRMGAHRSKLRRYVSQSTHRTRNRTNTSVALRNSTTRISWVRTGLANLDRTICLRDSRANARKTRSIMHTQRPSVVVDHARSSSRPLGKTREEPAGAGRPRSISTRHPTLPRLLWLSHARELDSRHTSMLHSFAAIDRRGPWNQPGVSWVWPVSAHLPPIVADPMEQWLYSMQMWPDGQTRPPANLLTFHSWSE